MGLDYFVRRACAPQQTLGAEGFLSYMQRYRLAAALRPGAKVFLAGKAITLTMPTADLGELDATLAPLAPACTGCTANVAGVPFGCYGFVAYPLTEDTEAWLMRLAAAAGVDAAVATNTLCQLGDLRRSAAEMRTRAGQFFTAARPHQLVWSLSDGEELVLTSDVLCDLLLFQAPEDPRLVPYVCGVLGLCAPGAGLVESAAAPDEIVQRADLARLAPATQQQQALASYIGALVLAYRLEFAVHADG